VHIHCERSIIDESQHGTHIRRHPVTDPFHLENPHSDHVQENKQEQRNKDGSEECAESLVPQRLNQEECKETQGVNECNDGWKRETNYE
jgi:hypothetical protein